MHSYPFQNHLELFRVLEEVFQSLDIRYYLIGGQARDLLMSRKEIPPYAVTRDVDLAVMVSGHGQFGDLIDTLCSTGFEKTKTRYRLRWIASQTEVDLLPFGAIAEEGIVTFPPPDFDLSVVGLEELLPALEKIDLDPEKTLQIPVAPIEGIFLLKAVAWMEKRGQRAKDLEDMQVIAQHYWDFYEAEVYNNHPDILGLVQDFNGLEGYGARLLGRHLAKLMAPSPGLSEQILNLLRQQAAMVHSPGPMLIQFAKSDEIEGDRDFGYAKRVLDHIIAGIEESLPPSV